MSRRGAPTGWRQVRSGAVIMTALVATALFIFFLDDVTRAIQEGPDLWVSAPEGRQLERGADVWVAGRSAGRVLETRFDDPAMEEAGRVLIRAAINRTAAPLIRADARAEIRTDGLLGPPVLALVPGEDRERPFDFSDTLRATLPPDADDVMEQAETLERQLEEIRPLAEALDERLSRGPGTLAGLRGDEELHDRLRGILDTWERLEARLEDGSALRLGDDGELAEAWRRIDRHLEEVSAAGPSRDAALEAFRAEMTELGERLAWLETRLAEGRGTAGRLLHDPELETQMRLLEARRDSLREELMADPLRWLRFRIF